MYLGDSMVSASHACGPVTGGSCCHGLFLPFYSAAESQGVGYLQGEGQHNALPWLKSLDLEADRGRGACGLWLQLASPGPLPVQVQSLIQFPQNQPRAAKEHEAHPEHQRSPELVLSFLITLPRVNLETSSLNQWCGAWLWESFVNEPRCFVV